MRTVYLINVADEKEPTEVALSILVESAKLNLSKEELKSQLGDSPSIADFCASYEVSESEGLFRQFL